MGGRNADTITYSPQPIITSVPQPRVVRLSIAEPSAAPPARVIIVNFLVNFLPIRGVGCSHPAGPQQRARRSGAAVLPAPVRAARACSGSSRSTYARPPLCACALAALAAAAPPPAAPRQRLPELAPMPCRAPRASPPLQRAARHAVASPGVVVACCCCLGRLVRPAPGDDRPSYHSSRQRAAENKPAFNEVGLAW